VRESGHDDVVRSEPLATGQGFTTIAPYVELDDDQPIVLPSGFVVANGNAYWTNTTAQTIATTTTTGGPVATLVAGQAGPAALAVNATTLYWTNQGLGLSAYGSLNSLTLSR
jgi:hypothetical protein